MLPAAPAGNPWGLLLFLLLNICEVLLLFLQLPGVVPAGQRGLPVDPIDLLLLLLLRRPLLLPDELLGASSLVAGLYVESFADALVALSGCNEQVCYSHNKHHRQC